MKLAAVICNSPDCYYHHGGNAPCEIRPTAVQPAGPFGGNSQSGKIARHGTQSGYVMHKRHGQQACQPCKNAHAAYASERRTT